MIDNLRLRRRIGSFVRKPTARDAARYSGTA
jgi:hypothetical protein